VLIRRLFPWPSRRVGVGVDRTDDRRRGWATVADRL